MLDKETMLDKILASYVDTLLDLDNKINHLVEQISNAQYELLELQKQREEVLQLKRDLMKTLKE